LTKLNYLWCF